MQLETASEFGETLRHGPDRRDADAAGDQHAVVGALVQLEIVARRADLQNRADADHVVQADRAAATALVALDTDRVAAATVHGADKGVETHHVIGQVDRDMGARASGRNEEPQW